jgi:hypothetical protein
MADDERAETGTGLSKDSGAENSLAAGGDGVAHPATISTAKDSHAAREYWPKRRTLGRDKVI